ncbi:MAG TPA: GNAT family N-acetyltransferase [Gemmataceae bacterium]|nr:GNAT family N-acetyltransferase [Gemmataceae bacterium]
MIRPTVAGDTPLLIALAEGTGVFKPLEIAALRDVLRDYHAGTAGIGHQAVSLERDGEIIGFAYFAPEEMTVGTWNLWWIVVGRSTQARGVGAELLRFAEDEARRAGARLFLAETSSLTHYEPTRRFYLKHGYETAAEVRDYYDDGDHMVVFRKRLDA